MKDEELIGWMQELAVVDPSVKLLRWEGRACATDTKGIVIMDCPNDFPELALNVGRVYEGKGCLPDARVVAFADLLAWAEGYPRRDGDACRKCTNGQRKCDDCQGTGIIEHECDTCGDLHDCDCQACDNGVVECSCDSVSPEKYALRRDRGLLFGVYLNRYLVAKWLRHLSGESVTIRTGTPTDPVCVSGDGWDAFISPTHPDSVYDKTFVPFEPEGRGGDE